MEKYTHYVIKNGVANAVNPYDFKPTEGSDAQFKDNIKWAEFEKQFGFIRYHAFDTDGKPMEDGEYEVRLFGEPELAYNGGLDETRICVRLKPPIEKKVNVDAMFKTLDDLHELAINNHGLKENTSEYSAYFMGVHNTMDTFKGYKSPDEVKSIVEKVLERAADYAEIKTGGAFPTIHYIDKQSILNTNWGDLI